MQWLCLHLFLLLIPIESAAHIATFHKLLLDLLQIIFRFRNLQRILHRKQIIKFLFRLYRKLHQCFIGTLQFVVFVEIPLCIFHRRLL